MCIHIYFQLWVYMYTSIGSQYESCVRPDYYKYIFIYFYKYDVHFCTYTHDSI